MQLILYNEREKYNSEHVATNDSQILVGRRSSNRVADEILTFFVVVFLRLFSFTCASFGLDLSSSVINKERTSRASKG